MYKIVLMRHGESQWNLENRFTGWADVDLTETGRQQAWQAGELLNWAEVRCASLGRLPMVGGVPAPGQLRPSTALAAVQRVAGLWTFCALGSRGLTLSALGAELLAARMLGEPLPVEEKLADALDPARFALKASRKSG